MSEKIVYEPLKTWQYGEKTGYYEPNTDTIHILLSDQDIMDKTLEHELKHRSRRNKPTFQLAILYNMPPLKNLMVLLMLVFGVYGFLAMNLVPFASIAIVYFLTFTAKIYEEKQAGGEKTK
jgi:hypothetical protein